MDLQSEGFLAVVQCVEVWCPMTPLFFNEYLKPIYSKQKKQELYIMNPNKIRACEFLIKYHEKRGDKIIVFSDNLFALEHYAMALSKPFLYSKTKQEERLNWVNL
jgi:DNA excision repair protein ERCC-3